jgi:hypothetical protein
MNDMIAEQVNREGSGRKRESLEGNVFEQDP